mgnify:CR=1 FL=1
MTYSEVPILNSDTRRLIEKILQKEKHGFTCRYCKYDGDIDNIAKQLENNGGYEWTCNQCKQKNIYLGWEWHEVAGSWHEISRLLRQGLVRVTYSSSSTKCYLLNRSEYEKAISIKTKNSNNLAGDEELYTEEDIFQDIIGYDDIKQTLYNILKAQSKVHILFVGPPACAKTLFLLALSKLPGAFFISGTSTSKAGLLEVLFDNDVKYLLIDEISELSREDTSVLYSLMQNGFITENKYGRHRRKELDTIVFGTTNSTRTIATPLLSRFLVINFAEYTFDEFLKIAKHMLAGIPNVNVDELARTLWYDINIKDVRIFEKVRELLRASIPVNHIITLLRKYGGTKKI